MNNKLRLVTLLLAIAAITSSAAAASGKKGKKAPKPEETISRQANSVFWSNPVDIQHRNLFFGPGGKQDSPHTTFTFIKEDLDGTSPKFIVRDQDGVKWKVKLGAEARPETVSSRLVWAVGYSTNEDYFMPVLHVESLPARLHRGQNFVGPRGTVQNVRLKRYL